MAHGNAHRNHLGKRDVHRVWAMRRYWHFTFSDQWGPILTDEWGDPANNMPLADEEHPFWDAFEVWQKARSQDGTTDQSGRGPGRNT
jgi:hypothetical protein